MTGRTAIGCGRFEGLQDVERFLTKNFYGPPVFGSWPKSSIAADEHIVESAVSRENLKTAVPIDVLFRSRLDSP